MNSSYSHSAKQPCPVLDKYAVKTTKEPIEQWLSVRERKTLNLSEINNKENCMMQYSHNLLNMNPNCLFYTNILQFLHSLFGLTVLIGYQFSVLLLLCIEYIICNHKIYLFVRGCLS